MYMAKQIESDTLIGRDRPVEIGVTPAMIEAGADVLWEWCMESDISKGRTNLLALSEALLQAAIGCSGDA